MFSTGSMPFWQYGLVRVWNARFRRSTLPAGAVPRRIAWSAGVAAASAASSMPSRSPPRPAACGFWPVHSAMTPVA